MTKKKLVCESLDDHLNEVGAGYAVWGGGSRGGYGNPSSRGSFSGRGFGFGSSNSGGPNVMYTYDIKPLNRTLEPFPSSEGQEPPIHIGSVIKGKILGKDEHIIGQVLEIEEDHDGNHKYIIVLHPDTNVRTKIDPTSAFIWEPEPEGASNVGATIAANTTVK